MPDLIATREQRYSTRMLKAGDRFTATEANARVLVALKRAEHAPLVSAPKPRRGASTAAGRTPQTSQPDFAAAAAEQADS